MPRGRRPGAAAALGFASAAGGAAAFAAAGAGGPGAPARAAEATPGMRAAGAGASAVSAAAAAVAAATAAAAAARGRAPPGRALLAGRGHGARRGAGAQRWASTQEVIGVKQRIDGLIEENDVVVFSKTWCPFCTKAKLVLQMEGVSFVSVELDEMPQAEADEMQMELAQMTGARTVPRIFSKGECLGGCDDIVELQQTGQIAEKLPAGTKKGAPPAQFKIDIDEDELRKRLSPQEFYVLRQKGTEGPGTHEFNGFFPTEGHFACNACGLPLYAADSKFRSNCGWPVFKECYFSEEAGGCHVATKDEWSGIEILCKRCESHLGHVFFDAFGPTNPNGERH